MNITDIEPMVADFLDARLSARHLPPYQMATDIDVAELLTNFFRSRAPHATVSGVERLGGGGSKEQFVFALRGSAETDGRYVLRMDPVEGVVTSSRLREHEALSALWPTVPVPRSVWIDPLGEELGRPAVIMSFCPGVTKPSAMQGEGNIVGQGTVMGSRWRALLSTQFVDHLAAIHNFDWRKHKLSQFQIPNSDRYQIARWQVGWWSRVWNEDKVASLPTMALAHQWMLRNLPACEDPVMVHGDYRTGNFLFDEKTEKITTILDWEMCHLGDPHEDLAWAAQETNGSFEDGRFYASSLMPTEDLLERYEKISGRPVNLKTFHFYTVFSIYKSMCICLASAMKVAETKHSHQNVLLTWMAGCGHLLHHHLCRALETEMR